MENCTHTEEYFDPSILEHIEDDITGFDLLGRVDTDAGQSDGQYLDCGGNTRWHDTSTNDMTTETVQQFRIDCIGYSISGRIPATVGHTRYTTEDGCLLDYDNHADEVAETIKRTIWGK